MVTFEAVSKQHVLSALDESDHLGTEAFLRRYGFKPAREYLLWHDGQSYESKAILGAAQRFAVGKAAISSEFHGGKDGAAEILDGLGFEIIAIANDVEPFLDEQHEEWQLAADLGTEESRAAWALAAREVLLEAAQHYHRVVTHKHLAALVQTRTGIRTRQLMHYWIGDVLARVSADSASRDEPLLSALCVDAAGGVGAGYAEIVASVRGESPEDPDAHAAQERLECHRFVGADLPEGGGVAALTPMLRATRATKRRQAALERPVQVCPSCHMALLPTGECDSCD